MRQGVQLAIEDVNRRGGAGGYPPELVVRDSATPGLDTIGRQYMVARQYAELVADPAVVAVIGPQSSLEGRAVAALVNRASAPNTRENRLLTGGLGALTVRSTMRSWAAGRTGFFGYYFSYRLPGGPMP
jgi:ABC-type branched-subunit amino acid transport system substrate-binding protein